MKRIKILKVFDPDFSVEFMDYCHDRTRLIRLFQCAWEQIPSEDRQTMSNHAKINQKIFTCEMNDLRLGISPAWALFNGHDWSLWVSVDGFNLMPDEVVIALLGHELAHAYQHAYETEALSNFKDTESKKHSQKSRVNCYDKMEIEADVIASCWGFKPEVLSNWKVENKLL